ncbi:hypothetical protein ACFL04_01790 [Patescibacteria group bacterium]
MKKAPIIIVIIIVAIGTALYFFVTRNSSQNNTVTPVNTVTANTATNPVTNTESNTNTEDTTIPPGSIALFYRESLGTVQQRLRTYDVSWESSSSVIVRELPELDQYDGLASYTSKSYSKQSKYPYTNNGRLFLLTDWGSDWAADNTRWDLTELDPQDGKRTGTNISFSSGSFAVAGDILYYTTPVTTDSLTRLVTSYGKLMAKNMNSSAAADEVLTFTGYEDRGSLYGVGDSLLLINFKPTGQRIMTIYTFDPVTQTFSPLYSDLVVAELTANNIFRGDTALYLISQEDSTIFVDRYPVDGQEEGLLEIDLETDEESVYVAEDRGQVLVYVSSKLPDELAKIRLAIIYDLETQEFSEIEVGPFSIPVSFSRIGVPFLVL